MPTIPPDMTRKAKEAYADAMLRIEDCRQQGKGGTHLELRGFGLTTLPPDIGKLTALKELHLQSNQLTTLPPQIGQLPALTELYLSENQLTTLPPQIGQLTALTVLHLMNNQLTTLPPEIGKLTELEEFVVQENQLTTLPPEIGKLTALTTLAVRDNLLTTLPPEIGKLTGLKELYLLNNRLTTLPPEIGHLSALCKLYLNNNRLTTLPPQLGELTELKELYLFDNRLTALPSEIGQLAALEMLQLNNNPLQEPPLTVCEQGVEAIQRYFSDRSSSGTQTLWRSKLMLVGQGRVGKTELRHRLLRRPHGQAVSTEVMEIETVPLAHPQQAEVTMELRCWDFGGQDIYHATHQFFLTGRSLFVLCFEAGKDWEAGKPYYWLDKIAAVAPDAPVVVVATKGDERAAPSLPWLDLKKRYPQLVGENCFTITTKAENRKDQHGDGVAELIACLQNVAADRTQLPLMGESLPVSWIKGMEAVAKHPHDHYLKREAFCQLLLDAGVEEASLHTVAVMLRDLGEILFYCDDGDEALHEWVIIKPTWVTHAAARILDSADVKTRDGILTQAEMSRAWKVYPPEMQPVLLDLLEKYDLTYKIPDDPAERSLVVEKLPTQEAPPPEPWEALKPMPGGPSREMQMTFRLASMQAGIPTWFIARKHYYTLRRHWLHGGYFGDNRNSPRHVALVRANTDPKDPSLELTVRGPFPQTFFAVMKEGLEASIRDRYPRLIEKQTIPCCCQDEVSGEGRCGHMWEPTYLEEMIQAGLPTVRCQKKPFKEITIRQLLSGFDDPVADTEKNLKEMEERIRQDLRELGDKMDDVADVVRQNFQYLYQDLQQREDTHCPPLFVIWKAAQGKAFHVPLRLALVCQHPGHEHIACTADNAYHIDALNEWLRKSAPLLKKVGMVLKYAKLTGLSAVKEWDKAVGEAVANLQETVSEMLKDFDEIAKKGETPELLEHDIGGGPPQLQEKRVAGAALREFRALLDKVDPTHQWHGLEKKRWNQTGDYLWVCAQHAALPDYKR